MARSQTGGKEKLSRKEKVEQKKENEKMQEQLKTVIDIININDESLISLVLTLDCLSNHRRCLSADCRLRFHEDTSATNPNGITR